MKILVADKFPESGLEALRALGATVEFAPDLKGEDLTAAIAERDPDVLVVRSTEVKEPQFDAASTLSLVIRAGAGVNTIDVALASERGVYVANCPGKNSLAVAELAFGHLLALDRHIVDGAVDLRAGQWNKKKYGKANGMAGRTLGLVGLGRIGQAMVERAHAFGMQVVAWSRSLTPDRAEAMGVTYAASPLEVAHNCDCMSVHVALNDDTRGFIGEEIFSALPEGALFVNTARGEVVDQPALEKAVRERGIRAGLDVFANEPKGGTGTLEPGIFALAGVIGSHHIGASTEQAQAAVADETVAIVRGYIEQGAVRNCVNLASEARASHLLVVRHRDRVGVLARVLGQLRDEGINVQEMSNALFAGGAAACASIQLGTEPSPALLDAISHESEDVLAVSLKTL